MADTAAPIRITGIGTVAIPVADPEPDGVREPDRDERRAVRPAVVADRRDPGRVGFLEHRLDVLPGRRGRIGAAEAGIELAGGVRERRPDRAHRLPSIGSSTKTGICRLVFFW